MRVVVLNGPNLNLLGRREPHLYGRATLDEVEAGLIEAGRALGVEVRCAQHNGEGALIDEIHAAWGEADGIRDALVGVAIPYVEVHVTNVYAREPERRHSALAPAALAVVCGFGVAGYELALRGLVGALRARAAA